MGSLWAAGLLLRRLRSERGVILLIFVLVAGTSFVFAAAPRLFNRVSDDAIQHAVRVASPIQRTISASFNGTISARAGDSVQPIRDRGARIAERFSPAIAALVVDQSAGFASVPMLLPGGSPTTRLLFGYQDGLADRTRLVSGRWPEDRGVALRTFSFDTPPDERPDEHNPPDVFEAAISAAAAAEAGFELGEHVPVQLDPRAPSLRDWPSILAPTAIEIVGIYDALDETDPYWGTDPDLLRAIKHGTLEAPIDWVTVYVPPETYPNLAASELPFQYDWRYPTAPERYESDAVPELAADLRRLGVNAGAAASDVDESIDIRTGLPAILEAFTTQRALAETVLSIATLGPFGLAAGAIAMVALLLARQRRATLALARGRGASGALVLGTQLWEGIVVAGGAALLGLGVAIAVIPARASPQSTTLALAVGAGATLLLLGASWATARRSLGNLERDDAPLRAVTIRRLVVEATIVFLAVAAALLLRDRGLSGPATVTAAATAVGTGGAVVNPLLAAVPVLAGLAAGIVALRLYPFPIRALGWLAARRRDFVPVLGLRTIGRHPGAANLPLLVLLLTAAFGAFASTLSASLDRGQVTASYLKVGADFRIERVGAGFLPDLEQVTAVAGVEATARGLVDSSASFASTAGQRASLYLAAVEPDSYARVVAGSPAEVRWPAPLLALPDSGAGTLEHPIPAILSTRMPTGSANLDPGDTFEVRVAEHVLVFRLIERRDTFPGIDHTGSFAVAPLDWVQAASPRSRPDILWVRAASDSLPGLLSASRSVGDAARLTSRYDALTALRDAPLEAVIATGYMAALIVAAIYMALAIVGAMVLSAAGRTRDLAYLRTLGISARQAFGLTVMEHGPPVLLAVVPGVALGIGIALLVEPGLGLATFVGIKGVPLYVDSAALAAMVLGLIVVVASAVGIGTWLARRVRPADALRSGET